MPALNRRNFRIAVFQTIFELEFRRNLSLAEENAITQAKGSPTKKLAAQETEFDCQKILQKNLADLGLTCPQGLTGPQVEFGEALLEAVLTNYNQLKAEIQRLAPDWPFSQTACLDRSILLTGLAEIRFLPQFEIPTVVTLNEFVEIAKTYSDDSCRCFVNGVLNAAINQSK